MAYTYKYPRPVFFCVTLKKASIRNNLHYFIPYFKGKGIRDVYEITRVRNIKGSEAKQIDIEDSKDDLRLAFHLKPHHHLSEEYKNLRPHVLIDYAFLDTTFGE